MKFNFLLFFCLLLSIQSFGQRRVNWKLDLGGGSSDRGAAMAVDGSGNIYITGYFQSTVNFDEDGGTSNLTSNGGLDIFVAKYNSSRVLQWAFNLGGGSADQGLDIVLDASNNVYVSGYFQGSSVDFDPSSGGSTPLSSAGGKDIFLAKYDTDGNFGWAFNIGGANDEEANSLVVDGSNNIYIGGYFESTSVDFDPSSGSSIHSANSNSRDIFIAKYNSSMALQWSKSIGGSLSDAVEGFAVDNSDNLYVTGSFTGGVDFNPGGTPQALASSSAGGSAFIAKYNDSGTYQAKMQIGGVDFNEASGGADIVTDGSTNIYVTGAFANATNPVDFDYSGSSNTLTSTSDSGDIFVAKYTTALAYVDAFRIGGTTGVNAGFSLDLDASNNIYLTGTFTDSNVDFNPSSGTTNALSSASLRDFFFAKYDQNLNYIEAFSAGNTLDEYGLEVHSFDADKFYIIGYHSSANVDIDPATNTSTLNYSGVNDIFVVSYFTSEQPLPVELTYFKGKSLENTNLLTWQTATEKNNSHFEIEWSETGDGFIKISEITGHGTTTDLTDYEFQHRSLTSNVNYYRLKQVDFDGKFEYSPIIMIENNITEKELTIFPNPTQDFITIQGDYQGWVNILNVNGQIVHSFQVTQNEEQFSLNNLKTGIYFLQFGHEVIRIIKE